MFGLIVTKYGADIKSYINFLFFFTLDPPRNTLVSVSFSVPLLEGSSVNLTCSSHANPAVENYTWFKKDGTDTSQTGSGEVLALTSLPSSDSGQYFCEARNREGAHKSTVVSLTIQGANQGECRGKCPVLLNQYVLNEYIFSCIVPCHFQLQRLSKCQFTSVPRPQFSW